MANRGGFDLVAQAMSGIISVTGTPEHPAKCSVPLSDLNAGLYASHAILAALIYRMKTGRGQYIDASLLDSAIAYTIWETNEYWATGRSPIGLGTAHRNSAPYQTFQTSDGAIAIGAANQRNWERLVQVLGLDGLLDDPRFATNSLRFEHRQELEALLAPQFATRTTDQWLQALDAAQVPVGPVLSIEQMVNHPQVMAREMTVSYRHPVVGDVHGLGMPVKFSQTPARLRRPAPMLGQHTFYLLKTRLGMTDDQCARLEADGVVLDAHWKGEPDGADAN
jgi:formyl-CoA transferase